jgi:RNA polymerase sigma-70 factor (ECF subfamily)
MHVTESPWISMQVGRDTLPLSLSDDGRTVEEVRRLDPHAVGAIYDRYFIDVYRYVRYRINDDGIAEDVASDVFVRLLEALRKAQGPQSNVRSWLLATASNAVNDHLRRQYRRPLAQLTDNMQADANVSVEVDEREQNRAVKRAYTQLTAEQQHVLALRFGLGYSLEETAEQLKKKVNAVKALQFRALASLQRMMRGSSHE